jgi:hypothetical protein
LNNSDRNHKARCFYAENIFQASLQLKNVILGRRCVEAKLFVCIVNFEYWTNNGKFTYIFEAIEWYSVIVV